MTSLASNVYDYSLRGTVLPTTPQADAYTRNLEQATTVAETVTVIDAMTKFFRDMADDISQLPTTSVDSDAVALGADYVESLQKGNLVLDEMRTLLNQLNSLQSQVKSPSMFIQTFIRGFMGDPLGTYNDVRTESQQMKGKLEKLQEQWTALHQQYAALNAREIKLRVTLSDRYHREFPPLSSPRPRSSEPPKSSVK